MALNVRKYYGSRYLAASDLGPEARTAIVHRIQPEPVGQPPVTKLVAYRQSSILSRTDVLIGLALGLSMIMGSYVGMRIVERLPERTFIMFIEVVLITAGLAFLIRG